MSAVHQTIHPVPISFILILSFRLCLALPIGIPFRSFEQNFVAILPCLPSSHACYTPRPAHLPWFYQPNNIWGRITNNEAPLCAVFSFLLLLPLFRRPQYSSQHRVLKYHQSTRMFSVNCNCGIRWKSVFIRVEESFNLTFIVSWINRSKDMPQTTKNLGRCLPYLWTNYFDCPESEFLLRVEESFNLTFVVSGINRSKDMPHTTKNLGRCLPYLWANDFDCPKSEFLFMQLIVYEVSTQCDSSIDWWCVPLLVIDNKRSVCICL
jgi:hypothetical protein